MRLSFACGDYDRVRPLREGHVRADGLDLTFLTLEPEETFFRQLVHHEFDVSELSLSSYAVARSRDDPHFVAIPVFPSRTFRHSGVYVNAHAGIVRPEDLRGKRVGLGSYQMTMHVWLRGILEDEHGVHPREIHWYAGGLEQPGRRDNIQLAVPPDVQLERIPRGQTLSRLLERGDLDAVFSPRMPEPFLRGSPNILRLFPDYRRVETEYFRRTRVFPIMHTVVIRRAIYERAPWIAQTLTKALTEAKRAATAALYDTNALPVTLPWPHEEIETARELMGEDWWPYGVEPNRATLETFLRYAGAQGLLARSLAVDELFARETLETFRI